MPEFEAPVGTQDDRNAGKVWPTGWWDATPYGEQYEVKKGKEAIHTGADLNCKGDEMAPVYAMGDGTVIYAKKYPVQNVWGGLIIIYHGFIDGSLLYSRYGHVQGIAVAKDAKVKKGQHIARIGGADLGFDPHLHFDISTTDILDKDPGYWPRLNKAMVELHFENPAVWLQNRMEKETGNRSVRSQNVHMPVADAESITTELRYVIHPDGAKVRKSFSASADVVHELKHGASLSLKTAKESIQIQDGFMWGQINGGEFHGYWVAVCRNDPKVPGDIFLSKKQPL